MLFDIGKSTGNKYVRKKYIMYVSIFISEIIIINVLSLVLGVGTYNTWLGLVGANVIFLTIVIMLFDIVKSIKHSRTFVVHVVYFILFLTITLLVINNIIFIAGL